MPHQALKCFNYRLLRFSLMMLELPRQCHREDLRDVIFHLPRCPEKVGVCPRTEDPNSDVTPVPGLHLNHASTGEALGRWGPREGTRDQFSQGICFSGSEARVS